ncbi:HflX-like GTP-binding protein [Geodermatophilus sp. URMC 62]|uniref:HflX-like GTP-binding protein n=1 Tax=Geodermatophilus sp. URMC 62 TaxID=3423414 RepID=UPI00406CB029
MAAGVPSGRAPSTRSTSWRDWPGPTACTSSAGWCRREHPDPATYLGSGEVGELAGLVADRGAALVIADGDLSPAHCAWSTPRHPTP